MFSEQQIFERLAKGETMASIREEMEAVLNRAQELKEQTDQKRKSSQAKDATKIINAIVEYGKKYYPDALTSFENVLYSDEVVESFVEQFDEAFKSLEMVNRFGESLNGVRNADEVLSNFLKRNNF